MSIIKTISLSDDMFYKLKEEKNASHLIDDLLRKHYSMANMSIEEVKKELKMIEIEKKIEQVRREMIDKEFNNGQGRVPEKEA